MLAQRGGGVVLCSRYVLIVEAFHAAGPGLRASGVRALAAGRHSAGTVPQRRAGVVLDDGGAAGAAGGRAPAGRQRPAAPVRARRRGALPRRLVSLQADRAMPRPRAANLGRARASARSPPQRRAPRGAALGRGDDAAGMAAAGARDRCRRAVCFASPRKGRRSFVFLLLRKRVRAARRTRVGYSGRGRRGSVSADTAPQPFPAGRERKEFRIRKKSR